MPSHSAEAPSPPPEPSPTSTSSPTSSPPDSSLAAHASGPPRHKGNRAKHPNQHLPPRPAQHPAAPRPTQRAAPRPSPPPPSPLALAQRALDALRDLSFAVAADRGITRADAATLDHFIIPATVSFDPAQREPGEPDPAQALLDDVSHQVVAAQRASMAFSAGHVYCFLCDLPDCEHTRPPHPEDTFSGYTLSGRPEWVSFTNLCLARQHDRVDQLYSARPDIIAVVQSSAELNSNLLTPHGERALSYRVRGQVSAGLIPRSLDLSDLHSPRLALTLQIIEIRYGKAPLRLRANLLGLSRRDISDAAVAAATLDAADRLRRLIKGTDRRLRVVAYRANLLERRRKPADEVEAQLQSILQSLRGELERTFRPQRRRTQHAQERHRSGERPTSDALSDLLTARPEHLLTDTHERTTIVLGPKRRAHVFSSDGQHVTSLRLDPGELPRKLEQGRWATIPTPQAAALRVTLIGADDPHTASASSPP
jgi:hypothetical protein